MMRSVLLGLILLLLVGCGESTETTTSPAATITAPPSAVNGRVVPYSTVEVGFQISGQIAEWLVEPGAEVTKGQELARLDAHTLDLTVKEAEANLAQAEATLERVRVTASEAQKNEEAEADAPTPTPNNVASSEIREVEAAINLARVKLDQAKLQRSLATVTAPVAGIIGQRHAEIGETVSAGQAILSLGELRTKGAWRVQTDNLSELDVGRLALGQELPIKIDAFPEQTFTGKVARIDPKPNVDRGVVTYTVLLDLTIPEGVAVRWGMSARITMPE